MLALLITLLVRLLRVTWRLRITGESSLSAEGKNPRTLFIYWHGDQLALTSVPLRRRLTVLASRSRDGQWAALSARLLGLEVVRGSTSRGAVAGGLGLARRLLAGGAVGVAVDGPRGPRHQVGDGPARLARRTNADLVPVAAAASRGLSLRTWDRLLIPAPFSTVHVVFGHVLTSNNCDTDVQAGLDRIWRQAWTLARPLEKGRRIRRSVWLGLLCLSLVLGTTCNGRDRTRRLLESGDTHDRIEALEQLAESRDKGAAELIAPHVRDRSPRVRRAAVAALGAVGCRGHLNKLVGRLEDADLEVRLTAVRVLGDSKHNAARLPLLRALRDPSMVIRRAAAIALESHGLRRQQQAREVAKAELEEQISRLGRADDQLRASAARMVGMSGRSEGVEPLLRLLADRSPLVVEQAAWAAGRIGGSRVEAALIKLSRSREASDRRSAAVGLAELEHKEARAALVGLVADPIPKVRLAALTGLARSTESQDPLDAPALKQVCQALMDPEVGVASRAARLLSLLQGAGVGCPREIGQLCDKAAAGEASVVDTLSAIRTRQVTEALIKLAESRYDAYRHDAIKWITDEQWRELDQDREKPSGPSPAVKKKKRGVEWILAKFPTRSASGAVDPLLPPATTEASVVRAIRSLASRPLAQPWLSRVAIESPQAVRAAALVALAGSSKDDGKTDPSVEQAILIGLRSRQKAVKRAALRACRILGKGAVRIAVSMLKDKDFDLRSGAASCLGTLGTKATEAVGPLISSLRREHLVAVIQALALIGDRRATKPIADLLMEDHPAGRQGERVIVVQSLGLLGDPAAISALERELSHPDWKVRRAAASALSRWARRPSTKKALTICQQDYYTAVRQACSEALATAKVKKPDDE